MEGVTYKLGLNVSALLTGAAKGLASLRTLGTAGAASVRGVQTAAGGLVNALWKLPDIARSIQGGLSALSLPSKLAGSLETTNVAFGVLLGSSDKAKAVLGEIKALAAQTPFEFPELADAARALAAFGEKAEAIPDVLRRIGDISSGVNAPIGEIAEIYGRARVAGTLFAEDINQLTGRGIPVIQQFAAIAGVSAAEVKKLAEQGKITFPMLEQAFKNLTNEGGQFNGMMGEISKTFTAKLGALSDSFKRLLSEMGAGVNEGLKPVMDELTKQLDGQHGLARQIGDNIGYGIETALQVIKNDDLINFLSAGLVLAGEEFGDALEAAGARMVLLALRAAAKLSGQDPDISAEERKRKEDAFVARHVDTSGTVEARSRLDFFTKKATDKVNARRNAAAEKERRESVRGVVSGIGKGFTGGVNWLGAGASKIEYDRRWANAWKMSDDGGGGGGGFGSGGGTAAGGGGGGGRRASLYGPATSEELAGLTPLGGQSSAEMFNDLIGNAASGGGRRPLGMGTQRGAGMGTEAFRARFGDGGRGSQFRGLDSNFLGTGGQFSREAERRGGSDRMKAAAAKQGPDQAAVAQKALALLEKHLPEIAKTLMEAIDE